MAPCILVVDDSATMRSILKTYLARLVCTLVEASSAEEALSVLESQKVDLVVSDVWLHGMSGLDLTQKIRAAARWRGVRLLLISMDASAALPDKAIAAGADAFMQKPLKPGELRDTVTRLLAPRA